MFVVSREGQCVQLNDVWFFWVSCDVVFVQSSFVCCCVYTVAAAASGAGDGAVSTAGGAVSAAARREAGRRGLCDRGARGTTVRWPPGGTATSADTRRVVRGDCVRFGTPLPRTAHTST